MNLTINNKTQSGNSLSQRIPSLSSIINNITKLALPVLGIIAVTHISNVQAGETEYEFCMRTCPSLIRYLSDISQGWIPEMNYESAYALCHAACKFNLLF